MNQEKIAAKDRAEIRRLVEVYGRKLVEREVISPPEKPPRKAGRKSYVGGGEDVWLQHTFHKRQMVASGGAAAEYAERDSNVARSMVKQDPTLGLSAKSVANIIAKVNARRARDPQYKARLDWLLASLDELPGVVGGMSEPKVIAGRLKSDGSARLVKLKKLSQE